MMSTNEALRIEPPKVLRFKGPFDVEVTSDLLLTNTTEKRIYFRVKTTRPQLYCVRPNNGFIEKGITIRVSVVLQPSTSDSRNEAKHKFMVQYLFAPENASDVDALWNASSPSDFMSSKLSVIFDSTANVVSESNSSETSMSTSSEESSEEEIEQLKAENEDLRRSIEELKQSFSVLTMPSQDNYNIEVKKHAGCLLQNLNSARNEGRLCDFLVKVGSREFHVHKIILSEISEFFRGMFSHKMRESETGVAEMNDVDPDCMCICIEYIYTGKVSVPKAKILPLLKAAHLLLLHDLCNAITSILGSDVSCDSVLEIRDLAIALDIRSLLEQCDKYSVDNFKSLAENDQFKDFEEDFVQFLIESKDNEESEDVKCKALINWANSDPDGRKGAFEAIFLKINLAEVEVEYLMTMEENEPLVYNSARCMRHLFRSASEARLTAAKKSL